MVFNFQCMFGSPMLYCFGFGPLKVSMSCVWTPKLIGLRSQGLHHLPLCVYWPLIHFAVISTTFTLQQFALFWPLLLGDTCLCQSHPQIPILCCSHLLVTSNVWPYNNPSLCWSSFSSPQVVENVDFTKVDFFLVYPRLSNIMGAPH